MTSFANKKRSSFALTLSSSFQSQSPQLASVKSNEALSDRQNKHAKKKRTLNILCANSAEESMMDALFHHLHHYEKYGLPRPAILSDTYQLDDDWRPIIEPGSDGLLQQYAILELIESEVEYLKTLDLLANLFIAVLNDIQSSSILNDVDRDKMFSNIQQIHKANVTLWLECMYPMVQKARDTRKPLQPSDLHHGFLQFAVIFKPYLQFCVEQPLTQNYIRTNLKTNPLFRSFLEWCESKPPCSRQKLSDILMRLLHGLMKYGILLGAILKHTSDPNERLCVEEMIVNVQEHVANVNSEMRNQQENNGSSHRGLKRFLVKKKFEN